MSRARVKFGVKLPAISGNPDFERVFRAQMNTLEWLPIFLPSLWLFAIYIGDGSAAAIGAVWVVGRILYVLGYAKAVEKRGPGFAIQALAAIALLARRDRRDRVADRSCVNADRTPCRDRVRPWPVRRCLRTSTRYADQGRRSHFVSGQPLSLADGNALSPGTTASCL